jgi:non-heme chloroperoxidase
MAAQSGGKQRYSNGFVTTPEQIRIHYLAAGRPPRAVLGKPELRRPSLLFVPGWTMPAWIWGAQIDYFSKDFYVVAMDPRSQGESTVTDEGDSPMGRAADIQAVIESLGLRPVILVGWSQGVADVAAYFKRYGSKGVAGFVMVDGFAGVDLDEDMAKAFVGIGGQVISNREKFTELFVRNMYATPQSDEYISRLVKSALKTPTAIAVEDTVAMLATDDRAALKEIDEPTLLFTPKGGRSAPTEEAMHADIAGSEIEEMQGVGHALFVDKADAFNERLAQFITARILTPSASQHQMPGAPTTPQ